MTVSMRKWTLRNLNLTRGVTEARGEDGEATEVVEAGWLITSRIRKNHVKNPEKYTKYSLEDVPEVSNKSNSAAAFDFAMSNVVNGTEKFVSDILQMIKKEALTMSR